MVGPASQAPAGDWTIALCAGVTRFHVILIAGFATTVGLGEGRGGNISERAGDC